MRRLLQWLKTRPPEVAPAALRPTPPLMATPGARGLLEHQQALVIGAGPNIGAGIVTELARAGAAVTFTNWAGPDLEATLTLVRDQGLQADGLLSDATDPAAVAALLDLQESRDRRADILVLNVGRNASEESVSISSMDELFRTNVTAPLHIARSVAGRMRAARQAGTIIFITSVHQAVTRGDPIYSATKAALAMAMREMALEFAPAGIRVNAVAPGWVATDADGRPRPHRLTPLGQRSILPGSVGRAVVFLAASSLSPDTTGAVLSVDGGESLVSYCTSTPRPPAAPG